MICKTKLCKSERSRATDYLMDNQTNEIVVGQKRNPSANQTSIATLTIRVSAFQKLAPTHKSTT
jgi:hypothetical protein